MTLVKLTKAAELTGKSASTITRRSNHKDPSKRISFTTNDAGEKLYDVAELERAFGKLHTPQKNEDANVQKDKIASARNDLQLQLNNALEEKNALLKDKIASLELQNEDLRNDREDLRKDRDEWRNEAKKKTVLIEDLRAKEKQADNSTETPTEKKKGFWSKILG